MTDYERDFLLGRNENVGAGTSSIPADETAGHAFTEETAQEHGAAKKRSRQYTLTRKGIALIASVCILLSGVMGFSGAYIANGLSNGGLGGSSGSTLGSASYSTTNYDLAKATGSELSIQEIIGLAANSVVEIRTEKVATDMWLRQYVTDGAGSGVIVSNDGYILTNNHVIEGANKITVTLKDGKEYTATLAGTDSQTDIAVIKIDATGLTSAVYGDSDALQVGDLAVAIGNPLGELGGSASAGIVSALDRQLTIDGKTMTLIQTDASINPGNSGGGLFNDQGQLIGIVVAKSSGSDVEGLGFAIPINTVKTVAQQLVDNGYVKGRPAMGLTLVDLTSMQNALSYGVRTLGIYVEEATGSNAQAAGFQKGDMLYYIGDQKISTYSDVTTTLQKYKVGDTVKVTVVRGDQMVDLNLKLSEKTS